MPDELRAGLEASAATAGRSLNAEIVSRLLASDTASPERSLRIIETQGGLIALMGKYLKMMSNLAKKGNPEKLEQILLIEALAETLENGDYESSIDVTDAMAGLGNSSKHPSKKTP